MSASIQKIDSNIVNRKEKKVSVPIDFKPHNLVEMGFDTSQVGLKNYLIVTVAGPGLHPEAVTIHRPIGMSRLGNEAFVATRTTDVHFLLSNSVDPNKDEFDRKREIVTIKFFITKGLLFGDEKDPHYPISVQGGGSRSSLLAQAGKGQKADRVACQKAHDEAQKGKTKAAQFRYGKPLYDFMPEDMKEYEKRLVADKSDPTYKELMKDLQSPYETRGGPGNTVPQKAIPILAGVKNWDNASAKVFNTILEAFERGPLTDPGSAPPPPPGEDGVLTPRERIAARKAVAIPFGYEYGSSSNIDVVVNERKIESLETKIREFEEYVADVKSAMNLNDLVGIPAKDFATKANKLLTKVAAVDNASKKLDALRGTKPH
jgi:hypothetical protein